MVKGISIYLGLEKTLEENIALMKEAAKLGFTKVFLSLHIPEADADLVEKELGAVVREAKKLKLALVGDVTADTNTPDSIEEVRLDDGFTPKMVAEFLKTHPKQKVVLNASTVHEEYLAELKALQAPMERIEALHNFYPRPHTGLGEGYFRQQNELFRAYGVPVGAFVASQCGKRGPLHFGLPTLEKDREREAKEAASHLAALGVDEIFMGDDGPSREELLALELEEAEVVSLPLIEVVTASWAEELLKHTYTVRPDEAAEVVRALESRGLTKELNLQLDPCNTGPRPKGTVTVDNLLGGRYKGEMQITKVDLPSAPEVNVLGKVAPKALNMLDFLRPGAKFRFIL